MKVVLGIFTAFAVSQSFASEVPNQYMCDGKDGSVNYTTTSKAGKPMFNAEVRGDKAHLPAFPELKIEQTLLGSLVTARDMHMMLVDGPEVRYTLVLPAVTLDKPFGRVKFDTVLVKTSVANPFFGPKGGPALHSEYIPVECEASQVQF